MEENIDYINELKKLGEYLNCDESIIKQALEKQRKVSDECFNKPIGDILVANNSIPKAKLIEALQLQRIDRLKNCPVFFGLSMDALMKVSRFIYEITLDAGLEFMHQNTQSNCLFLIVRGKALICRKDEDGEELDLSTLGPGECVGEMGYLSGDKRSATAKTIEDTVLLQIHYADLESLFDITPILAKNFLNIVANRLRKGNLRFQDTLKKKRDAEYSLKNLFSLLDMSNIFKLALDEEGFIERVVCTASKVLKAECASLFIVDKLTGELWSKVAEGDNVEMITVPVGKGLAGWVAQNNEIVNISDVYSDCRFNADVDSNTGYHTESILCAPIRNLHGEVIGVIQLINKRGRVFDKDDESILRAFSNQTAIAMENFQLYQKMVDGHKKISILLDISNSINHTLELEDLIKKIVAKISDVLNAERSSLFLLDTEKGKLYSKVAEGVGSDEINFSASNGVAGYVVNTGKIVNIKNAYEDERFNPPFDKDTGYRTNTILCAPVRNRAGKIFGVTEAVNKKDGVFGIEDEELLQAVTAQIAIALENAQLYDNP